MLIQFSFKNFKSFRDEAVLDLSAAKITEFSERVVLAGKERILPVAAIYGANASGKSNIYHAFEYMAAYVAESFKYGDEEEKFEIEKLAHDADNKKEETYKISSLHKKIDSDAFAAIPLGMDSMHSRLPAGGRNKKQSFNKRKSCHNNS